MAAGRRRRRRVWQERSFERVGARVQSTSTCASSPRSTETLEEETATARSARTSHTAARRRDLPAPAARATGGNVRRSSDRCLASSRRPRNAPRRASRRPRSRTGDATRAGNVAKLRKARARPRSSRAGGRDRARRSRDRAGRAVVRREALRSRREDEGGGGLRAPCDPPPRCARPRGTSRTQPSRSGWRGRLPRGSRKLVAATSP